MPYGDGTGPYGNGPIGWRRGPCVHPANHKRWPLWRGTRISLKPEEELEYLKNQKELLDEEMKSIQQRISELEK